MRAFVVILTLVFTFACGFGASASDQFLLLRLDGVHVKWGVPQLGTSARVRYAFVTSPMTFPGAINCEAMEPPDALLEASQIDRTHFRREVAAAFALWESAANIGFVEVSDPTSADILIGAQHNPRGFAFTNVDYVRAPGASTRPIEKSLICLNPRKRWKTAFDGNMDVYDIRYTIAHEVGHAIGLDHPSPVGQLMSFRYGEDFRSLRSGDVSGAVALYGKRGAPVVAATPQTSASTPDLALK